jgi:hypothetical protein
MIAGRCAQANRGCGRVRLLNAGLASQMVQVDSYALKAYGLGMLTVVESPIFQKMWPRYWDEDERAEFASFIALNPEAGAVVRGSGGVRKVRWVREGTGKSGGVRIVYLTRNEAGEIYLLTLYAKSESGSISVGTLKEIRRALEV